MRELGKLLPKTTRDKICVVVLGDHQPGAEDAAVLYGG
jgi:hypothetical protein